MDDNNILPIIQLEREDFYTPDTLVRRKSLLVTNFNEEFQKEINVLIETLKQCNLGVGLSAPQVGILKRVFVINLSENKEEETLVFVNPEIMRTSGKKTKKKESCLSIPYCRGTVERREKLVIKYQNRYGEEETLEAKGFLARCVQHEYDHLDGILYIDRLVDGEELEHVDWNWD